MRKKYSTNATQMSLERKHSPTPSHQPQRSPREASKDASSLLCNNPQPEYVLSNLPEVFQLGIKSPGGLFPPFLTPQLSCT